MLVKASLTLIIHIKSSILLYFAEDTRGAFALQKYGPQFFCTLLPVVVVSQILQYT